MCCPSITSSHPMTAEPGASIGMSACAALAARSIFGPGPRNCSSAERPGGREQHPDERQPTDAPELRECAQPVLHRRERGQQCADDLVTDLLPGAAHLQPRLAVTRCQLVQACGGLVTVPVQHRPAAVGERRPDHRGGVHPFEPVPLELQPLDRRGTCREGVERAERVMDVPVAHRRVAAHGTPDVGLRLEDDHVPAGVNQQVGGDEPVGAAPDHDCVCAGHGPIVVPPVVGAVPWADPYPQPRPENPGGYWEARRGGADPDRCPARA